MKLDLKARLTFDAVQFDKDNTAHLVVSLKAPKIDWQAKRPRVCIVPVLDISPSMEGQKIQYAKQSIMKLIDHLQPGDFCGLVAFGGSVEVVAKPREVTQGFKDELKAKIGNLATNSATNFSGGMLEGLNLLNKGDLPGGMLMRAIMFTDGLPNVGVATTRPDILKLLEANLGFATISAFGYGADADQELLADVAKAGKGNYAFVRNPEDALSAFAKELGGLLSTFAQNLTIDVAPHNGHSIEEVISDVTSTEDGNKVKVTLSDILSEEERHIVFEVKLDKQPNTFPRESSVFDVKVEFDVLDSDQKKTHCTEELKAKVKFVKAEEAQEKPTPEVDRLVGMAQLVKAQIEAEEQAKAGNWAAAVNVMKVTSDSYQSRGLDDLAQVALKTGGKMGDAHVYACSTGYLSSMKSAGTRSYGTSSLDAEAAADLGVVGVSMSNSAQAGMVNDFGGDAGGGVGAGVVGAAGGGGAFWAGGTGHSGAVIGPAPVVPSVVVSPSIIVQQPGHAQVVPRVVPAPFPVPAAPKPTSKPKSKSKQRSKRW